MHDKVRLKKTHLHCARSVQYSSSLIGVYHRKATTFPDHYCTGKNNGFPFLDILGYLKNTHKNPRFGEVRQVPTREFPTKFPDWDLSHSSKFGIFVGIL